nr:ATP-binding protein [Deinococcota bacterium]
TSYALFLLYSLFNARNIRTGGKLLAGAANTKALIFNVKGEDLLFLDKPNSRFKDEERKWQDKRKQAKNRFEICNLPAAAFGRVSCHAPAMEGSNLMPDVKSREGVKPYLWTLHDFARNRMLPFVFTDRDAMTNLGFLLSHVEEKLAKLAQGQRGPGLEVERFSQFIEGATKLKMSSFGEDEALSSDEFLSPARDRELRGETERLTSFDDLVSFLQFKLLEEGATDEDGNKGGDRAWTANQAKATREAFIRRLRGASKHVKRLVRGDLSKGEVSRSRLSVLDSEAQVHVVDIHQLAPLAQMFVVGVLLKGIFNEQETRGSKNPVFIVLDELNKYAPAEGDSPIKDVLLDIAERGRSMGIILIGAQQTASEVERRIVGNAAVRIVGRLDAAEAERSEYRFMPGSFRARATILAPGTMIVHQPDVPSPMMVNFPFPAWATRQKEALEDVSDEAALDILG